MQLGPVHEAQRSKRGASKQIGIADSAFSMKGCTGRLGALGDGAACPGRCRSVEVRSAACAYLEAEKKGRHTQEVKSQEELDSR